MSFGTFYKVEDEVRSAFEGKVAKSEWYDVLGEIEIQNYNLAMLNNQYPPGS